MNDIRARHWTSAAVLALLGHVTLAATFPFSSPTSGALDAGEGGLEVGIAAPAPAAAGPSADELADFETAAGAVPETTA